MRRKIILVYDGVEHICSGGINFFPDIVFKTNDQGRDQLVPSRHRGTVLWSFDGVLYFTHASAFAWERYDPYEYAIAVFDEDLRAL